MQNKPHLILDAVLHNHRTLVLHVEISNVVIVLKLNISEALCSKPKGAKKVKGFQTGDLVQALVTTGKKQGQYVGRVLVRASGSFDITTSQGLRVQGIHHRFCAPVQKSDGYSYAKGATYTDSPAQSSCIRKGHSSPG